MTHPDGQDFDEMWVDEAGSPLPRWSVIARRVRDGRMATFHVPAWTEEQARAEVEAEMGDGWKVEVVAPGA